MPRILPPVQPRPMASRLPPNAGIVSRYAAKAIDFLFPSNDPNSWMPTVGILPIAGMARAAGTGMMGLFRNRATGGLKPAIKVLIKDAASQVIEGTGSEDFHAAITNRALKKFQDKEIIGTIRGFVDNETGMFLDDLHIENVLNKNRGPR